MGVLSWFYTNNVKNNMVVKIVHPGGHAELHDSPILAADILRRNPRCCVAHPNVFQQPWAIVAPDTTLMPGQKFYVVPRSTIRKLQRISMKHKPSLMNNQESPRTHGDANEDKNGNGDNDGDDNDDDESICCSFGDSSTPSLSYSCLKSSDQKGKNPNTNTSCFTCFLNGKKKNKESADGSKKEEPRLSVSDALITKIGESPKRHSSLDYWEPNLEIVVEEINTPRND